MLVHQSLAPAICESRPYAEGIEALVAALEAQLKQIPVPEAIPSGRAARLKYQLSRRVPRVLRRSLPPSESLDGPSFASCLEEWIRQAAAAADIKRRLEEIQCPGYTVDADTMAQRFPASFLHQLLQAKETGFKRELIIRIEANERVRAWRSETLERTRIALAATGRAVTAGGAGFGVAEVAQASESTSLTVAAISAGAALAANLVAVFRAQRASAVQSACRLSTRRWIADLVRVLTSRSSSLDPAEIRASLHQALRERASSTTPEARQQLTTEEIPHQFRERLLADLTDGLLPHARACGDDRLQAALIEVEDVLVRARRAADAAPSIPAPEILAPLLELLEATEIPQVPASEAPEREAQSADQDHDAEPVGSTPISGKA